MLIGLRALGAAVGVIFVVYGVVGWRSRRASRATLLTSLAFGLGLVVLAVSPAAAFEVRDRIGLPDDNLAGLVATLVVSVFVLGVAIVVAAVRIDRLEIALDRQVLATALTTLHVPDDTPRGGLAVVIPALNEAANLPGVLSSMPRSVVELPVVAVVADDGSEDATRDVAIAHGAMVVSNAVNRGGGAALRLGYLAAARIDPAAVITMDADGQHDPDEMARLVRPVLDGDADLVIGSRVLGDHEPASTARKVGVHVFGVVLSVLGGSRFTDVASGYRAFHPAALRSLRLREDQFHTGETLMAARRHRLRITEVPITISSRVHGESKKPETVRYGLGFLRASVRAWFR